MAAKFSRPQSTRLLRLGRNDAAIQHSKGPKPTDVNQLKAALQDIWNELPQASIQKAIRGFRQRLQACIRVEGGHFEQHLH